MVNWLGNSGYLVKMAASLRLTNSKTKSILLFYFHKSHYQWISGKSQMCCFHSFKDKENGNFILINYKTKSPASFVLAKPLSTETEPQDVNSLYPHHIPTTLFQKTLLTVGSAVMALSNPARDDMVAILGETTGHFALQKMHQKMMNDAEGQQILFDQPRITSSTVDMEYLRSLPSGTLGHAYIEFLDSNQVSPDTRLPVQFVDNIELAYVMQRYREAHDLVHTLLGMPTNMLGEVAVKWIEGIQTGLPMCTLGGLFGAVRLSKRQRQNYVSTVLPWAIQCGLQSKFLLNVYFEKHWETPIEELRQHLNIREPPTDAVRSLKKKSQDVII